MDSRRPLSVLAPCHQRTYSLLRFNVNFMKRTDQLMIGQEKIRQLSDETSEAVSQRLAGEVSDSFNKLFS